MSDKGQTQNVPTTKKKISFFSAMLIVMGGSIGAGIFFKSGGVLSNSQGSLILAIFCWLIASCAVIAMALALIEISAVRNDNLSLIGWCKEFNSRTIYKASKNFMVYVYLPMTYFFMPLYVILSIQDGIQSLAGRNNFGTPGADWVIWTIISLCISIYFLTVPTLWSKIGDIHNKVVLAIKFVPLVVVTILGFVLIFTKNSSQVQVGFDEASKTIKEGASILGIKGIGAGLGMFLAISAIFFAYDGFYVASGIQSEMKEPKKTPLALLFGLGITTIIYLLISIGLSLNGGNVFSMQDNLGKLFGGTQKAQDAARILIGILNLMIGIGVLGIINGFSMWAPRFVEDLLAEGELPFWNHKLVKGKLNPNFPKIGVIYSLVLSIPTVLIFTLIGALGYIASNPDYVGGYDPVDKYEMAKLYSFADLMANWTALFTFSFIGASIFGGIRNRKTNRVKIEDKKKYFVVSAWIAVVLVFSALLITLIVPFIDFFAIFAIDKNTMKPEDYTTIIISRLMLVVVLFLQCGLAFIPTIIEDKIAKKKYGSLEKFEEYKKQQLSL
ncbi:APC family permease [Mycoplasma crocodyli]|uniref:Putative amino acid permease n=1 Tax=Mycoplasma crocodyli (strain ATCC 51981 / MP145) TaxID=512564 RepID=D5E640_MYCCM|nr:APC family permease [Mycoplasma crocodyli]ADE19855.1 putative amino acid permease [Mycoplasma crocodyli MP145]